MIAALAWWGPGCRQEPSNPPDPEPTGSPEHSSGAGHTSSPTVPTAALVFEGAPPTNLIVLSVDTMRRDHLSRYDPLGRDLTPFLAARMAEGVAVDDWMHCANWTIASSTCLAAGRSAIDLAAEVDMVPVLPWNLLVPRSVPPHVDLASTLTAAGFDTRLYTANSWFGPAEGAVPGFTRVDDPGHVDTSTLAFRALADLADHPPTTPFYVHLHSFEPHDPYAPPERLRDPTLPPPPVPIDTSGQQRAAAEAWDAFDAAEQSALLANLRDRYQGDVRWYDEQLAALWGRLDDADLLDDALVVFHSDHGEGFHDDHAYFGHGGTLYAEENAGFVAFWARNLVPGATATPAVGADLAPSILTALGQAVPAAMTGVPLGTAPVDRVRTAFTAGRLGPIGAARKRQDLMMFRWLVTDEPVLRCDLAADPGCRTNLYRPDAVQPIDRELWAALEAEARAVADVVRRDDPRHPEPPWPPELVSAP
jgi:arylsulfatase A-like enzyme